MSVHEAAERLRKFDGVLTDENMFRIGNDKDTLARWALPVLDSTPIDEAWLTELGRGMSTAIGPAFSIRIDELSGVVVWARASGCGWTATMRRIKRDSENRRMTLFCDLRDIETRGQLRLLLAALGITKG